MRDSASTFRRAVTDFTVSHLGVVTTNTADPVVTNLITAIGTVDLGASNPQNPYEGWTLKMAFRQTGETSTGTPGTATLTVKVDYSKDNFATVNGSVSSSLITFTFAGSAATGFTVPNSATINLTPCIAKMELPFFDDRYVRVLFTWGVTGSVTAASVGLMEIWLEESGQIGGPVINVG